MRTRRRGTIEELRLAIDCLPRRSRIAMLEGIDANRIIVGAYSNANGICPMLAAHRAGGRTNLIAFARAWDRFAFRGARVTAPRPATARELLVLRSQLEASLLTEDVGDGALATTIAAHHQLVQSRKRRERGWLRQLLAQIDCDTDRDEPATERVRSRSLLWARS